MKKLTESNLVIPVLAFLKANGGSATIAEIKNHILATYPLSEADLKMSDTRKGEHVFEQQIRNLRSHSTLAKLGFAEEITGGFRLLPGVADMLDDNPEWAFEMIATHSPKSVRKIVDTIDTRAVVVGRDNNLLDAVADFLDLRIRKSEHGCHCGGLLLASLLHGVSTLADEL